MPYNGSGGTSQPANSIYPATANTLIESAKFNVSIADIYTMLGGVICKDGQTTTTQRIPFAAGASMGSQTITAVAAGTATTHAANVGQIQGGAVTYLTSVAGTDTITAIATPAVAAYAVGQRFSFIPAATNTTAATLNISTVGAGAIRLNGAALTGGEMRIGVPVEVLVTAVTPVFEIVGNGAFLTAVSGNAIINGAFNVAQRGTSFTSATTPANSDDTYLLDRWILLSDGNDTVDVTQNTSVVPTGGLYSCALDVETANRKFGILQVIEQKNCIGLIGNTVTLSFKAKVSATTKLDNLKAAIIAWDGTADTVTSDIISAWGVEGTNPTLVANWTYENTPANLSPTTSYATYSVSAAVDTASTTNIGVFIWSDVTDTTVGDFLYITDIQLEAGNVATTFERRSIAQEIESCQRYCIVFGGSSTTECFASGVTTSTTSGAFTLHYPSEMRVAPTLAVSAVGDFRVTDGGGSAECTVVSGSNIGTKTCQIDTDASAGWSAASRGALLRADTTAAARITLTAEL